MRNESFDGRFLYDQRETKECAGCYQTTECLPIKIGSVTIGFLCGHCYREFESLVQYGQITLDEAQELVKKYTKKEA